MTERTIEQILLYAEQFFGTQNDPTQLPATRESFDALLALDERGIVTELTEEGDLIGWMVTVPTTAEQMESFVNERITEAELFSNSIIPRAHTGYVEAVYLCAVFVLPEYRQKGYGRGLVQKAVRLYREENSEAQFFTWPWSCAGRKVVKKIADEEGITITERPSDIDN